MGIKQQAGRLAFIVLAFSLSGAAAQKLAAPQVIKGSPVVIDADTLQFDGITVRLEGTDADRSPAIRAVGKGQVQGLLDSVGPLPIRSASDTVGAFSNLTGNADKSNTYN